MTPPDEIPVRRDDDLERALRAQELLPAPPDLAAHVVARLGHPGRRLLSIPALARLAAAVLLAVGTWVATLGGLPTRAHAAPPAIVTDLLTPTRELLPAVPVDLSALDLEDAAPGGEDVPAAALAGAGVLLLGAGLLLARRPTKEKTR